MNDSNWAELLHLSTDFSLGLSSPKTYWIKYYVTSPRPSHSHGATGSDMRLMRCLHISRGSEQHVLFMSADFKDRRTNWISFIHFRDREMPLCADWIRLVVATDAARTITNAQYIMKWTIQCSTALTDTYKQTVPIHTADSIDTYSQTELH